MPGHISSIIHPTLLWNHGGISSQVPQTAISVPHTPGTATVLQNFRPYWCPRDGARVQEAHSHRAIRRKQILDTYEFQYQPASDYTDGPQLTMFLLYYGVKAICLQQKVVPYSLTLLGSGSKSQLPVSHHKGKQPLQGSVLPDDFAQLQAVSVLSTLKVGQAKLSGSLGQVYK